MTTTMPYYSRDYIKEHMQTWFDKYCGSRAEMILFRAVPGSESKPIQTYEALAKCEERTQPN